jgi:hypothetical protein
MILAVIRDSCCVIHNSQSKYPYFIYYPCIERGFYEESVDGLGWLGRP